MSAQQPYMRRRQAFAAERARLAAMRIQQAAPPAIDGFAQPVQAAVAAKNQCPGCGRSFARAVPFFHARKCRGDPRNP